MAIKIVFKENQQKLQFYRKTWFDTSYSKTNNNKNFEGI